MKKTSISFSVIIYNWKKLFNIFVEISGGWKPKARNMMLNATFTSRTCKFTIWRWRCPTCAANSSFPSWRRCTTSSWWEAKNKFETRFCCDFKTSLKPYIFNYKNLSANQNQLEKILLQNQTHNDPAHDE